MVRAVMIGLTLVLTGCVPFRAGRLPANRHVLRERLVLNSDVALDTEKRLLDELVSLQHDMEQQLRLRASHEPIFVHLFAEQSEFDRYCREEFPELVGRSAYFVDSAEGLNVLACWGEHITEDLRHEVAHGYLHSVAPRIPLWLDEGLAEYFEMPPSVRGLNGEHVHTLLEARATGGWTPDLSRLEGIVEASELSRVDYAEGWLWVHFLMSTGEERQASLLAYLEELQSRPGTAKFAAASDSNAEALLRHLDRLALAVGS